MPRSAKGTLTAMVPLLGLPIATGLAVWLRTEAADLTLPRVTIAIGSLVSESAVGGGEFEPPWA